MTTMLEEKVSRSKAMFALGAIFRGRFEEMMLIMQKHARDGATNKTQISLENKDECLKYLWQQYKGFTDLGRDMRGFMDASKLGHLSIKAYLAGPGDDMVQETKDLLLISEKVS